MQLEQSEGVPALIVDAILHQERSAPVRLNPQVRVELERVIAKAIEEDRKQRYQMATDLAAGRRARGPKGARAGVGGLRGRRLRGNR
jgi:hypothetical protein